MQENKPLPYLQRNDDRLLIFLAGVLLACSFFYRPNIGGTGVYMPQTYAVWIGAILLITVTVLRTVNANAISLPRQWFGLVLLPAGLILSGFVVENLNPIDWMVRIGFVVGGFLFFFSLFQYQVSRRALSTILFIIAFTGLLHTAIAFMQSYGDGWWYEWVPLRPGGGIIGFFQQVNLVSSFAATTLAVSIYLATLPDYGARNPFYKSIILANLVASPALILATGSRAGLLGLILVVSLLTYGRYRLLQRNKRRSAIMILAIGIGVGSGFLISNGMSQVEEKLSRVGYQNSRLVIYRISWELFLEKPLLGHGIGSYPRVFQEKRFEFYKELPDSASSPHISTHPHNELLFWLVEAGLISVLGILVAILVTIRQLVLLGRERGASYLALLTPIGLQVAFELPFYLSSTHWFVWLIFLWLVHFHFRKTYKNGLSRPARFMVQVAGSVSGVVLIIYLTKTISAIDDLTQFVETGNIVKIQSVNENLFLSQFGSAMVMRTLLYTDIARDETKFVDSYIKWAEKYVWNDPRPVAIVDLTLAYSYANQFDKAKLLIERAASIYPGNEHIQKTLKRVREGSLVEHAKKRTATAVDAAQEGGQKR